jgi:hypothetical protein
MTIIKIPGPRFIILESVNQVEYFPDINACCITWSSGDAPLALQGESAIAFITALERLDYVDATNLLTEQEDHAILFFQIHDPTT